MPDGICNVRLYICINYNCLLIFNLLKRTMITMTRATIPAIIPILKLLVTSELEDGVLSKKLLVFPLGLIASVELYSNTVQRAQTTKKNLF